ncbi:MAG: carboxypeptidase-like regulatory domain-containing protein [Planctomycetaceae bacterium]
METTIRRDDRHSGRGPVRSRFNPALLLAVIWLTGCGGPSGPELVPLHGVVTSNGRPVPGVFISFLPEKGRPSWALSDESGNYAATYSTDQAGVLPGTCRVWVTFKPSSVKQEMAMLKGENPFAEWTDLLKKYGSERTTALHLTVSADEPEMDLKLDY